MDTSETLKRRIATAEDLQSVVKTMKALAAASIRQYELAVHALAEYNRTVELGLQVVLQHSRTLGPFLAPTATDSLGAIVFGSDQGMCGQLNDQIVAHALETLQASGVPADGRLVLAVGARAAARLEDAGQPVEARLPVPGSASGIGWMAEDVLLRLEEWHEKRGIRSMVLLYHQPLSRGSYRPRSLSLLPADRKWLRRLGAGPWPSRALPTFTMDRGRLFSALIRQYLFVSICRAFASALASEHASRLASMQSAERNIEDRLEELHADYRRQRQMAITGELLDLVAGFEALEGEAP